MKTLSRWAFHHPWSARIMIVVCHSILISIAIVIGILLQDVGIQLPVILLTSLSITFLVFLLKYPSRQKLPFAMSYTYARAKLSDLALVVGGFCMVISLANQDILPEPRTMPVQMMIIPLVHQISQHKILKHERKELRKELKNQIREYVNDTRKGLSGWAAILIALGFVIAFFISVALIAALSCSLSCSGSGPLAAATLIGGIWLSIYLLVIAFRWLSRKRKERKEEALPESA
ncbi:MAG TPA: hypothetical protein VI603_18400 [Saprospiraceae bacterium]|nr:hypothetical protein [Saprospiraceae bacterium]